MEPTQKGYGVKFKYFKFNKAAFTYDGLYYELLYDFADRKLPLKDYGILKLEDENNKKENLKYGIWFHLLKEMKNKIERNNNSISKLGYLYTYKKAKIKYIQLMKEALRLNKQPKDIVRVYVHKCKEIKINHSLQKVMKIGKFVKGSRSTINCGLIQRVSNIHLTNLNKLLSTRVDGTQVEDGKNVDDEKESKFK